MFNPTILKTPKEGLSFLMLTFFVYVTAPFFEWLNLQNDLATGKLPTNADSIGLGFAFFLVSWILFAPFVLGFTVWIVQEYPAQISLFGFNRKRPLWSLIWTLIFAFLIFDTLVLALKNLAENWVAGAMQNLLLIYF